jgi:hypothetical protein
MSCNHNISNRLSSFGQSLTSIASGVWRRRTPLAGSAYVPGGERYYLAKDDRLLITYGGLGSFQCLGRLVQGPSELEIDGLALFQLVCYPVEHTTRCLQLRFGFPLQFLSRH